MPDQEYQTIRLKGSSTDLRFPTSMSDADIKKVLDNHPEVLKMKADVARKEYAKAHPGPDPGIPAPKTSMRAKPKTAEPNALQKGLEFSSHVMGYQKGIMTAAKQQLDYRTNPVPKTGGQGGFANVEADRVRQEKLAGGRVHNPGDLMRVLGHIAQNAWDLQGEDSAAPGQTYMQAQGASAKQRTLNKKTELGKGREAVKDLIGEVVTDPLTLETLGSGALPKVMQRALMGAFVMQQAPSAIEQIHKGITEKDTYALTKGLASAAMTGAIVKHLGSKGSEGGGLRESVGKAIDDVDISPKRDPALRQMMRSDKPTEKAAKSYDKSRIKPTPTKPVPAPVKPAGVAKPVADTKTPALPKTQPWQQTRQEFVSDRPRSARSSSGSEDQVKFENLSKQVGANKPGKPGLSEEIHPHGSDYRLFVFRDKDGVARGVFSYSDPLDYDFEVVPGQRAKGYYDANIEVSVDPDWQRKGIATKMYEAAKKAGVPVEETTGKGGYTDEGAAFAHRRAVTNALEQGENVPPEVLKDYPDLTAKPARKAPKASPEQVKPPAKPNGGLTKPAGTPAEIVKSALAQRAAREKAVRDAPKVEELPKPLTGAKNAVTEAEEAARGNSPIEREMGRTIGASYYKGKAEVDSGNIDPRTLAHEIADKPRPVTDAEIGALAYDRARLVNDYNRTNEQLAVANQKGETTKAEALRIHRDAVDVTLRLNSAAFERSGSEQSSAFRARQMMVNSDYSLGALVTRAYAESGKPLSEADRTQLETLSGKVKELEKTLASEREKTKEMMAQHEISRQAKGDALRTRQTRRAQTKDELDKEYTGLHKQLKKSLAGQTNFFADPSNAPIVAKMVANRAKSTGLEFSRLIDDVFADVVKSLPDVTREDVLDAVIASQEKTATAPKGLNPQEALAESRLKRYQKTVDEIITRRAETKGQKTVRIGTDLLSVPRSIMETGNLHATLRQGLLLSVYNPKAGVKALGGALKAFISEAQAEQLDAIAKSGPNAGLYEAAGLHLAEKGMEAREEAFQSSLAERIPILGRAVRASGRTYSVQLNILRTEVFDHGVELLRRSGKTPEADPKAYQDLASLINKASGWGDLGKLEAVAPQLNLAFYSPRLQVSRFQMMLDAGTTKMVNGKLVVGFADYDPVVRKMAIKGLAANAAVAFSVMGLAKTAGAKVGTDPDSADFGKIIIGNSHIDLSASFGPYIRYIAKIGSQQYQHKILGKPQKFNEKGPVESTARLVRTKLSPIPGAAVDALQGKDILGQPVTAAGAIGERFSPLVAQEIYAAMKENDWKTGSALIIPSFFGLTEQSYKPTPPKAKASRASAPLSNTQRANRSQNRSLMGH